MEILGELDRWPLSRVSTPRPNQNSKGSYHLDLEFSVLPPTFCWPSKSLRPVPAPEEGKQTPPLHQQSARISSHLYALKPILPIRHDLVFQLVVSPRPSPQGPRTILLNHRSNHVILLPPAHTHSRACTHTLTNIEFFSCYQPGFLAFPQSVGID